MTVNATQSGNARGHLITVLTLARVRQRLKDRNRFRQRRLAYARMLHLDDRMLRDIGLTRDQVAHAARAPLSEDVRLLRRAQGKP